MRYVLVLGFLLILTWPVAAKPQAIRAEGRLTKSNTEQHPITLGLQGKLFSVKVRAFVTDNGAVRVRVVAVNLAGPQAFFSTHVGLFGKGGKFLGGGGQNDVYHEKKKGQESDPQWDILLRPQDLQQAMTVQCVFYEDSTFIGRR